MDNPFTDTKRWDESLSFLADLPRIPGGRDIVMLLTEGRGVVIGMHVDCLRYRNDALDRFLLKWRSWRKQPLHAVVLNKLGWTCSYCSGAGDTGPR